jgi:hypothetical protein
VIDDWGIPDLNDMFELVFVYETLIDRLVRDNIFKRDVITKEDSLENYKEVSYDTKEGQNYHTILPDMGSVVSGIILLVTPIELNTLDRWEEQYERKQVVLRSGLKSFVYVLRKDAIKQNGVDYEKNMEGISSVVN